MEKHASLLFTPTKKNSNSSFQYDVKKFIDFFITKFNLTEKFSKDGVLKMKIAVSWDGTDFGDKNLFIWGIKIIDYLQELSKISGLSNKELSEYNCIPLGACFLKDIKDNVEVIGNEKLF